MRSYVWALVWCAGLVVAAPACSKTNNVTTSNSTSNVFSKDVDDKGGLVGEVGGLGVFIHPNSLGKKVRVTIREAEETEYPEASANLRGKVYAIEPHGLELATPATVHLPYPENVERSYLSAIHADLGGQWEGFGNGMGLEPEASTATFETNSFSFFALEEHRPGTMGASGGGGKGSASVGGTSGTTGGTPGSGGTGGAPPGFDYCPSDDSAPVGTTDINGNLALMSGTKNFLAVDGFATQFVMGADRTMLQLVFTETKQACGGALASGTPVGPKPIGGGTPGVSVSLTLDLNLMGAEVMPDTYPRAGQPEMIQVSGFDSDATCLERETPLGESATVIIEEIDGDHIKGTIDLPLDGSGTALTGAFDVPFCALPESPGAHCCVQP